MLKEDCPISINQEPLTISDSITHLGIDRYCSNTKFIADRISLARRAMYGLFGAGLTLWSRRSYPIQRRNQQVG